MINFILTLMLASANPRSVQIQPCVWPNPCMNGSAAPVAAIVPNVEIAQVTTCVYPRKCGRTA
ncbi:MAG: hypothetical protein HY403_12160 [Elusimicrobia bacterium]|nr:hypothetical protein [Elusimicrobiota bacterium]